MSENLRRSHPQPSSWVAFVLSLRYLATSFSQEKQLSLLAAACSSHQELTVCWFLLVAVLYDQTKLGDYTGAQTRISDKAAKPTWNKIQHMCMHRDRMHFSYRISCRKGLFLSLFQIVRATCCMFLFIDFWAIAVIKDSKCGRGGPSHKFVAGQHYKKNNRLVWK